MGDWMPRLPRAGAGAGGGGKRIKKQDKASTNPFTQFRAPGTASESSDEGEGIHALITKEVKPAPPSPPRIPKRAGSTPNSRSPQDMWVERIGAPSASKAKGVPIATGGGREELLKARAAKQQQQQQQAAAAASASVSAAASSESEAESAGGSKKRGRLKPRAEESDDEEDGDVLVSPPGRKGAKKKGGGNGAGAAAGGAADEVLVIDLDSPAVPVPASASAAAAAAAAAVAGPSSSSSVSVVEVEDDGSAAAAKRPKLSPGPETVEVVDDSGDDAAVGAAGAAGVMEESEGEEEGDYGDGEYDEEERAERARARGMLRACELISERIRAEVASWGEGQEEEEEAAQAQQQKKKRHAEDRLDLTSMGPRGKAGKAGGGRTEFVKAELLAKACPGVELKAYQLTGLNWLFLLHQLDLSDIPRELLPGGGKKRRRDGEDGNGGGKGQAPLRINGILADDMGLGKTCQTIAFLAYLRELQPDTHTHLIVVPASVLSNWEQELTRFAPGLEVWVYHGLAKERKALRLEYEQASGRFREHVVDVVLATYSYWEKEACSDDRRFLDKLPIEYLILDEGHSVKNTASGRFARLRRQRAARRLVLSGTPVQNCVSEMLALLGWLNPQIVDWGEESSPERLWELLASGNGGEGGGGERAAMARLKRVFAPFVLRRLKMDVLDQLTAKITEVETVALTKEQREAYDAVTHRHLRAVQEAASRRAAEALAGPEEVLLLPPSPGGEGAEDGEGEGEEGGKQQKQQQRKRVLRSAVAPAEGAGPGASAGVSEKEAGHIFTEWRKAASHPLLLRRRFRAKDVAHMAAVLHRTGYYGWECSLEMVRRELDSLCDFELHSIAQDVPQLQEKVLPREALFDAAKCRRLRELVPGLVAGGHRVLLFSAWTRVLDILQQLFDEVLDLPCLRLDGSTPVTERQALIDRFNAPDSAFPVFLLSTRAGGMGINLTSADTVILYDTDWNPAVNDQAVDRCHRIGQTKPVTVYVLVAADTVDETIYKRAAGKKEKSESLLDKGDGAEDDGAGLDGSGRRDASGSSEISRIVQRELQLYLEHRKTLSTPDSDGSSSSGEEDEDGDGGSYMEADDDNGGKAGEGLVEVVTVEDDDEGEGGSASKKKAKAKEQGKGKGAAAGAVAAGSRPPSRASTASSSSRRDSTGSTDSAGSRKRQSYSLLESIVDSEESSAEE